MDVSTTWGPHVVEESTRKTELLMWFRVNKPQRKQRAMNVIL
jgi:hypothetical protein